jgi:hypothetical protein
MGNLYFASRDVISFGCTLMAALMLLLTQSLAWAQTSTPPKLSPNLPRQTTNTDVAAIIDQQLNKKALGSEENYGLFCANMHTAANTANGSDKIIVSAEARQVPLITAQQARTRVDGRNGPAFGAMNWKGNDLNFTVSVGSDARTLAEMLPITEGPDN